jgi:ribose transport system substrate-binding protein
MQPVKHPLAPSRTIPALLTLAVLGLTACKHQTYYLVANNLKLPYWQTVDSGFNSAAGQYHVSTALLGPDGFDSAAELAALRQAIAAKPSGILISVPDGITFREEINSAVEAGIPVVTVDSDAPTSARVFFVGTDNLAAGHLGAQRLVEKLHGKGNIVFFTYLGQPNLEERLRGYTDILADHPQMKIIDVADVKDSSADTVFDRARQYLSKTGPDKIDAFVSLESSSGKPIADALTRANVTDRTIIAMDVSSDTLNLIKAGTIDSTVSQKPFTMGFVGLRALDDLHHHRPESFHTNYGVDSFAPYPTFINTGTSLVTKENVAVYLDSASKAQAQ